MKHLFRHELTREQAIEVGRKAWEEYSRRFAGYNPTLSWEGEHRAVLGFTARGIGLRGSIDFRENGVEVTMEVPLLLRPFKKVGIAAIEREISRWVAQAGAG